MLANHYISLIIGLMTAAIVAAVTPTIVTVTQATTGTVNTRHTYLSEAGFCLLVNETSNWFSWQKPDGSIISINTTAAVECELQHVHSVAASISYDTGVDRTYRYSMTGIPVSNMAIGAPFALGGGGFHDAFGMTADNIYVSDADYLWIKTCLPTIIRNPVRCQATGNVTISGNLRRHFFHFAPNAVSQHCRSA
ncbi:hypothetical protein N431DRAFT_485155 [Stipitochalara longipes BDJ]|nr:hypothetical protein N431DRAFT_485155 [Stipitochalara longipes BDJ]